MQRQRRAQSILEYSVVLGVVIILFTLMQVYLKRGVQAGVRVSADQLGRQVVELPLSDKESRRGEDVGQGGRGKLAFKRKEYSAGGASKKEIQETEVDIPAWINGEDKDGNPIQILVDHEAIASGLVPNFDGHYLDPQDNWACKTITGEPCEEQNEK